MRTYEYMIKENGKLLASGVCTEKWKCSVEFLQRFFKEEVNMEFNQLGDGEPSESEINSPQPTTDLERVSSTTGLAETIPEDILKSKESKIADELNKDYAKTKGVEEK